MNYCMHAVHQVSSHPRAVTRLRCVDLQDCKNVANALVALHTPPGSKTLEESAVGARLDVPALARRDPVWYCVHQGMDRSGRTQHVHTLHAHSRIQLLVEAIALFVFYMLLTSQCSSTCGESVVSA